MTGTSGGVPPLTIMIFPLCFSCGMCLIDTSNGLLMLLAYTWTSVRPIEKLFYNFVVTSMSAGIALVICSLELLQIVVREVGLTGSLWSFIENVDMAVLGYSIILAFLVVFAIAVLYTRGWCCWRRCAVGGRALEVSDARGTGKVVESPGSAFQGGA